MPLHVRDPRAYRARHVSAPNIRSITRESVTPVVRVTTSKIVRRVAAWCAARTGRGDEAATL